MGFSIAKLLTQPYVALFIAIALGGTIGKYIKIRGSSIGSIAGVLIVAILIGVMHKYVLPSEVKDIFFALFIFALGYSGGQVLMSSLTKKNAIMLTAPIVTVITVGAIVILFSYALKWNPGIAGGMVAGAITTSASIAASSQAIATLGATSLLQNTYNTYVLSTYSITYVMGCFLPILICTIIVPLIYHESIAQGAQEESSKTNSSTTLEHKGGTDFLFFGLFITLGFFIGSFHFSLWHIVIELGSGVGCVLSGILLGFLNSKYPKYGNISDDVASFLTSFGLSTFVACVGLASAKDVISNIMNGGEWIFVIGSFISVIPMITCWIWVRFVLREKNPAIAASVIAASRNSNPAGEAVFTAAGAHKKVAIAYYSVSYVFANILIIASTPIIVTIVYALNK